MKLELSGKWRKGAFAGKSTIRFGGQSQEAKFEAEPQGDDGGVK